jgi:hypothetical protein
VVWDRRCWHRNDFHQCIADFAFYRRPGLTVVDAYNVMKQNGPRGVSVGDVVPMKSQIVSTDCVADDAAAAKLFGAEPDDIRHIQLAAQMNLGRIDLDTLSINRIKLLHQGLHRLKSFRVGVSVLFFALIAFLFLDFRNIVALSVSGGLLCLQFVPSLLKFLNVAALGAAACTATQSVPWARCWVFSRRSHFFKSASIQVSARDASCAKACARRAASIKGRRR